MVAPPPPRRENRSLVRIAGGAVSATFGNMEFGGSIFFVPDDEVFLVVWGLGMVF